MAQTAAPARSATTRRNRAAALLAGAVVVVLLFEVGSTKYYWLPLVIGVVYLAGALIGGRADALWGPAVVLLSIGLAAGLWLDDGRSPDSFQFAALALLTVGTAAVIAAFLSYAGIVVSTMSVGLPIAFFGAFALAEQQAIDPIAGNAWFFAILLAVFAVFEYFRPNLLTGREFAPRPTR